MRSPNSFYVASSLENADQVRGFAMALVRWGYDWTYDWTRQGSVQSAGETVIREVAMKEMNGIHDADVVFVLFPGGRGTHVELGAAIALMKRVVIVPRMPEPLMQDRICAFYLHPGVEIVRPDFTIDVIDREPTATEQLHKFFRTR